MGSIGGRHRALPRIKHDLAGRRERPLVSFFDLVVLHDHLAAFNYPDTFDRPAVHQTYEFRDRLGEVLNVGDETLVHVEVEHYMYREAKARRDRGIRTPTGRSTRVWNHCSRSLGSLAAVQVSVGLAPVRDGFARAEFVRELTPGRRPVGRVPGRILGTDLGVSFERPDGRLVFLFGDTHLEDDPRRAGQDTLAHAERTADPYALDLTFEARYPIAVDSTNLKFMEVPLDGICVGNESDVFVSTDGMTASDNDGLDGMGQSVLARLKTASSTSLYRLHTVSNRKFINVSCSATTDTAVRQGLGSDAPALVMFGSRAYRSSDIYLAWKPLDNIAAAGGWQYFVGDPFAWSMDEFDAVPLTSDAAIGELSARFHESFRRWIMLYNLAAPTYGVVLRHATAPWGPWSQPTVIYTDELGRRDCILSHDGLDPSSPLNYQPWPNPQRNGNPMLGQPASRRPDTNPLRAFHLGALSGGNHARRPPAVGSSTPKSGVMASAPR
jgi:hypothetical protein